MKCPHCKWRGTFRAFGKHMAKKHRRVLLKQLKKARKAPRKHKEGALPRKGPVHRGRKREVHMTEREAHKFCRQCGGRCPDSIHDFCSWCGARCP